MTKKRIFCGAILGVFLVASVGCSKKEENVTYKDGVYTGKSSEQNSEEDGYGAGYGEVKIEIKDGKIVSCEFETYELDGTLKDEKYGEELSKENRLKAQKAVQSAKKYAEDLVKSGKLSEVDAKSGATVNYNCFCEAVEDALSEAKE